MQDLGFTRFVDATAPSDGDGSILMPYNSIQVAIDSAVNGDTIVLRDGIYTGNGNRNISFRGKAITLKSENGPEMCIIDCQGTAIDPQQAFIFSTGETRAAILDGVTIKYGYSDNMFSGSAILVDGSAPTVRNCIIKENTTAIVCINGSNLHLLDCTVFNNFPASSNCAIYNDQSQLVIEKCAIIFNNCMAINSTYLSELTIIDSTVSNNIEGIFICETIAYIANSLITGNGSISNIGGIYADAYCDIVLLNATVADNVALGAFTAGLYLNCASKCQLINSTIWNNLAQSGNQIELLNWSDVELTHCNIQGGVAGICSYYHCSVTDNQGNIDNDPLFVDADNGNYRLSPYSPCIDAGSNEFWESCDSPTDLDGNSRMLPGWYVDATGNGESPLVDIGAYEWSLGTDNSEVPYSTSFEEVSGFEKQEISGLCVLNDSSISIDGWYAEQGTVSFNTVSFIPEWKDPNDKNDYRYQYASIGGILARNFDPNYPASIVRVNCIPSNNSTINLESDGGNIVSVKFENSYVHLGDGNNYFNTRFQFSSIMTECWNYLNYYGESTRPELYSYENTWIELEIHLNWRTQTYSLLWKHLYAPGGEIICDNEPLSKRCVSFDRVTLCAASSFLVNRMSVSNEQGKGGIYGENADMWLSDLPANMDHPVQGNYPLLGKMWYDCLGEYVIKCCPVTEYSDPPKTMMVDDKEIAIDPWMIVARCGSAKGAGILGFWNASRFYNGDYYLKVEVYDDLGCLIAEEIKTKTLTFDQGRRTKEVFVEYPLIGKTKGQTYHYEERPDITVNWPGSFPFEFKRIYDDNLKSQMYPLFFGWTHNHNIRLLENCTTDWQKDINEKPLMDGNGLGIGKLWLCMPLGGKMYKGYVVPEEPTKVKYVPIDMKHLTLDQHRDYIIREVMYIDSTEPNALIDLRYTHYAADGMKMVFEKRIRLPYAFPDTEGVVDWMAYIGIDRQEDRFGNALLYTWNNQISGRESEAELSIIEIENNRTSVKLLFEDDAMSGYGLSLYSKLRLFDGNSTEDLTVFDAYPSYSDNQIEFCHRYGKADYYFSEEWHWWWYEDSGSGYVTDFHQRPNPYIQFDCDQEGVSIHRNSDYSVQRIVEERVNNDVAGPRLVYSKEYSYSQNDAGNHVTKLDYSIQSYIGGRFVDCTYYQPEAMCYRTDQLVMSSRGAILSQKTTLFKTQVNGNEFDPEHYVDNSQSIYSLYFSQFAFYAGGGGVTQYEYVYDDQRWPVKPTSIVEFLDHDGDGNNDQEGKVTKFQYDDYGNVVEERIYVNSGDYVLSQYEYHDAYNFQTKATTWLNYCHDDINGDPIIAEPNKSEQHWLYGLNGGTFDEDPNNNIFLVGEKRLLDENVPAEWEYAQTSYIYYPLDDNAGTSQLECGQLCYKKVMQDPANCNVSYYVYDENGMPSQEWQGASLDAYNHPVGNPQKRYFYNAAGFKELEADYLGNVQMLVLDCRGRVLQDRNYADPEAMTRMDFQPSFYDDNQGGVMFQHKKTYEYYYYSDKSRYVSLPTGGHIALSYAYDSENVSQCEYFDCGYSNNLGTIIRGFGNVGQMLVERRPYWDDYKEVNTYCVCDSMDRPIHIYQYNYMKEHVKPVVPYIKHTECGYNALGHKEYEKVTKVIRRSDSITGFSEQYLEKYVGYGYDLLGRMTTQATWINPNAVDANNVMPEVSDPNCIVVKYCYDAFGNRIYVIDPAGNVLFTDYDNAGRKTVDYFAVPAAEVLKNPDGSLQKAQTKALAKCREWTQYYLDGKLKSKTQYDMDGFTVLARWVYIYDARGRVQTVDQQIDQSNHALTNYYYSDDGTLAHPLDAMGGYHIIIEDAESKKTGILLSYHGKPLKITFPSGDWEEYIYYRYPQNDCLQRYKYNGLLEQKAVWKDGLINRITYEYDDYGKISKVIYPGNHGSLEYEYTSRVLGDYGKVMRIVDKRNFEDNPGDVASVYLYDYDLQFGSMVSYTDADGYIFEYDYNTAFNRVTSIDVKNPVDETVYAVNYGYDLAGRLTDVRDITEDPNYPVSIAKVNYDLNGNRSRLSYSLNGTSFMEATPIYRLGYDYNADNMLRSFSTHSSAGVDDFGSTYSFCAAMPGCIDGLGRLRTGRELISRTDGTVQEMTHIYQYDMMSQLKQSFFGNVGGQSVWDEFEYAKDGNITEKTRTVQEWMQNPVTETTNYGYTNGGYSDIMSGATGAGAFSLTNDLNGNTTKLPTVNASDSIEYNWDNKLRYAQKTTVEDGIPVTRSMSVKYDPMGNRVWKQSFDGETTTRRKYIVDINSQLPVILCELDGDDPNILTSSYFYADAQILAQRDHTDPQDPNVYDQSFYVHDRLGSVRLVVVPSYDEQTDTWSVNAANAYTYTPFGGFYEGYYVENIDNPFKFTGQWHDAEIDQYYLRARMYDPAMMRFTGRDPVMGRNFEPLTLHKYLYCSNAPTIRIDLSGKSATSIAGAIIGGAAMYSAAIQVTAAGVDRNNDALFELGLNMMHLVAPAMYVGAAMGSGAGHEIMGSSLSMIGSGARAAWSGIYAGVESLTYMSAGTAYILTTEIVFLAMTEPQGFAEFITNALGDPTPPTTVGGAAGTIINWSANYIYDTYFD